MSTAAVLPAGGRSHSLLLLLLPVAGKAVFRRSCASIITLKVSNGIGNNKNNPGSAARTAETLRDGGRVDWQTVTASTRSYY